MIDRYIKNCLLLTVACLVPLCADTLQLLSSGSNAMGGVYVNPYTARLTTSAGATSTVQILCDDFHATVSYSPWTVTAIGFNELEARLSETRWGNQTPGVSPWASNPQNVLTMYYQVAWLTNRLLSESNLTVRGQLSYALWSVFTTNATTTAPSALGAVNIAAADMFKAQAVAAVAAPSFNRTDYNNFVLYTPDPLTQSNPYKQEMVSIRTPEPGTIAIWVLNMFAVVGVVLTLRRRIALA